MTDLSGFEGRLDELTTRVLMPLRGDKSLNGQALTELEELVQEIGDSGIVAETIPTAFAGKLWFVFYAMHDEADHARAEAGAIRRAAAGYQEALRVAIFGPWWGRGR